MIVALAVNKRPADDMLVVDRPKKLSFNLAINYLERQYQNQPRQTELMRPQ